MGSRMMPPPGPKVIFVDLWSHNPKSWPASSRCPVHQNRLIPLQKIVTGNRTDGRTDKRTNVWMNGQVENTTPLPVTLTWRRHKNSQTFYSLRCLWYMPEAKTNARAVDGIFQALRSQSIHHFNIFLSHDWAVFASIHQCILPRSWYRISFELFVYSSFVLWVLSRREFDYLLMWA